MECYNCGCNKLRYVKEKDAYVCLQCGYVFPKQYFFISHSHLDIEKVRIVRNIIEETFFYEPILFFLKCLSDDNEIKDLIRREIDERIWFVYCKSKNAEASAYVQEERRIINDFIKKGKKKRVLDVNLDNIEIWDEDCSDKIRSQIAYKIKKTKIFLSYHRRDTEIAREIYAWFRDKGYSVWLNEKNEEAEANWGESIRSRIKEHSYRDGLILLLASEDSLKSGYVKTEIENALARNAFILPVLLTNGLSANEIPFPGLRTLNCFTCTPDDMPAFLQRLESKIESL